MFVVRTIWVRMFSVPNDGPQPFLYPKTNYRPCIAFFFFFLITLRVRIRDDEGQERFHTPGIFVWRSCGVFNLNRNTNTHGFWSAVSKEIRRRRSRENESETKQSIKKLMTARVPPTSLLNAAQLNNFKPFSFRRTYHYNIRIYIFYIWCVINLRG